MAAPPFTVIRPAFETWTVLLINKSPSSQAGKSNSSKVWVNRLSLPTSSSASTTHSSASLRTIVLPARLPANKEKAPRRTDLPAPVSPVTTVKPLPKSSDVRSIRAKSRMERRLIISGCVDRRAMNPGAHRLILQ